MTRRLTLLLVVAAAGCNDPDNWLEGSISSDYSLEFEDVAISIAGCRLRVDYVLRRPAATYVPCRLDVDTEAHTSFAGEVFLDDVELGRIAPAGRSFPVEPL